MSATHVWMILATLFLAYSNGANDNFKGVATLFGSGSCSYLQALLLGTVATMAGALLALVLAPDLVKPFQGKGLVPDAVIAQPAFLLAVSLGAALTILLATWTGMPVSTTHALPGSLLGAGWFAAAGDVQFNALVTSFILPLVFSPIVALLLTVLLYAGFRWGRRFFDLGSGRVRDGLHYLSGGAVSFARGLSSTPKIVALPLAGDALSADWSVVLVTLSMALGGLLQARRVAETMSRKITPMDAGQGLTANGVTALLVVGASHLGFPVSTTHVAVGALFGIGTVTGKAQLSTILAILLAWVTTVPVGALLAAVIYLSLRAAGVEE